MFTGRFYDGTFSDNGEIGAIEFAVRGISLNDRQELLAFFEKLRHDKLPPHALEEVWWKGSSHHSISRETIGVFFELIIQKLEESLRSDRLTNQ